MTEAIGDAKIDASGYATGECDGSSAVPICVSNNKDGAPALICKDLNDWLLPEGRAYQGLLIQRPQDAVEFQQHVDNLAESEAFRTDMSVEEHIQFPQGVSKQCLAVDLPEKARRLAELAVQHGLPEELGKKIQDDFQQIGMVLAELAPAARKMCLKLDIMGEASCSRWHRDHYVGRAIVTYNSCGTQYVANQNVNFNHLDCGACDDLIRDESQIFNAGVGDILFMKGTDFPCTPNGLVHRSPPRRLHETGQDMNRLLLKVDLLN